MGGRHYPNIDCFVEFPLSGSVDRMEADFTERLLTILTLLLTWLVTTLHTQHHLLLLLLLRLPSWVALAAHQHFFLPSKLPFKN